MSGSIDLVLFDFDGTLAETEFMSVSAISRFLAERGISASATEVANITSGVGRVFVPSLLEGHFGLEFDDTDKQAIDDVIVTALEGEIAPTNGTVEMLVALTVPHCIASNAPRADLVGRMRRAGLLRQFGPRFFSSDDTRIRKPAPDLFLLAAEVMDADPSRCLVVEDSAPGLEAARAAGMSAVLFTGGKHQDEAALTKLREYPLVGEFNDMKALLSYLT
jgi:HAD superfamily hydrolase (TIGR01509 family)